MPNLNVLRGDPTTPIVLENLAEREYLTLCRSSLLEKLRNQTACECENMGLEDFEKLLKGIIKTAMGYLLADFWHQIVRHRPK